VAADRWPLLQKTAAATAAWVIAKYVLDHHEPFFAPIAAVVALNTALGERGLNALRLLEGVFVGIIVGELTLLALSGGYGSIALATFVAMAAARALGGARIVLAQAAVGAILVVASANADAGGERLVDALVGAGVALFFSQFLFSPEPVALLHRAEGAALTGMGEALELTAQALERDDDGRGEHAMISLRELRDHLAELSRMRRASPRVARRSAVWRSRTAPVVRESENAGHLDLLGSSCLMLARTAAATNSPARHELVRSVRGLAEVLEELGEEPGDRARRQHAADRALETVRPLARAGPSDGPLHSAAVAATQMVAADLMAFTGVEPEQAVEAVLAAMGEPQIPASPA
jgi:uncharacterized membrane protein YgaE (UPF0421/DUF939 family)